MRGDIPTNLARNSVASQKTTEKSVAELMSDRALSKLYKSHIGDHAFNTRP